MPEPVRLPDPESDRLTRNAGTAQPSTAAHFASFRASGIAAGRYHSPPPRARAEQRQNAPACRETYLGVPQSVLHSCAVQGFAHGCDSPASLVLLLALAQPTTVCQSASCAACQKLIRR